MKMRFFREDERRRPDDGFGLNLENILPEGLMEAEEILTRLADVFFPSHSGGGRTSVRLAGGPEGGSPLDIELPDAEARYRTLVEQIPAVVFMAFLDKGIGEAYVSPQIEAMLGFSQEEWLNDPVRWYQQIHSDDKARWSAEAAQMFLSGEPLRSVYRVIARDGHVIWFHCEAKMVRGADGRPWFIHGVAFDVTELKQAEEALKKNEAMLRGLFEFAPDTVVVVNHKGRILRVNAQVERMFGYDPEELIGGSIEALVPERFKRQHTDHRSGYVAQKHTRPMGTGLELYGKRKDGTEFPVDIMLSPMQAEEGGMVIAVVRDITKRKQAEGAVREYAERLKFLSRRLMEVQEAERRNIARELHDEIGQVLTGLKLTLEMGARLPPGEARESLKQAQELVNGLMARARKLSLDLRPAMLDDLGLLPTLLWHIENYTAQTRVRVNFKNSGLEGRRFAPELETAAYRIVQEGLTNIARHAEVSEAMVRVWTDQRTLTIEIEDAGRGFDQEALMAGSETSGLSGMRERAVLLGGELSVESHRGEGTRLTAELRLGEDS
ncbi:MAG TPA: PAS domain S-box protein [Blastocatellia bacterium]|jgi:PAS domain S-box-containing protein|nr:PAS domain S-box protein [Blastocatellia bacterium]